MQGTNRCVVEKNERSDSIKFGGDVKALAECIVEKLKPHCDKIEIAGSIRREKPDPRDIDIVLIPKDKNRVKKIIYGLDGKVRGGEKLITVDIGGIHVDFYFAEPIYWGAMLMTVTGSSGYNIGYRRIAKSKGMKLNQYGLWDLKTGERVASRTEEEIYDALGKKWKEPWLRG